MTVELSMLPSRTEIAFALQGHRSHVAAADRATRGAPCNLRTNKPGAPMAYAFRRKPSVQ